jgi:uncharacterized protein (DUF433 family)
MNTSLLSSGIYSIPEASRLIGVHPARLRWWICGRPSDDARPLIKRDLPVVDHQIALSFVNLIEARFIAAFASHGVHVRSIRIMAEEAQQMLGTEHPFARDGMFRTDGKKIYLATVRRTKDPKLYDLKTRNWAMPQVLAEGLKTGVEFGVTGLARVWYPRKALAPSVSVSPVVAFGQPALHASGIPTVAIRDAVLAEEMNYGNVARWFDITVDQVNQAVKFETSIKTLH